MTKFNLSDKIGHNCATSICAEDVKEFIRLEEEIIIDLINEKIIPIEFFRRRDKLAGDALTHSPQHPVKDASKRSRSKIYEDTPDDDMPNSHKREKVSSGTHSQQGTKSKKFSMSKPAGTSDKKCNHCGLPLNEHTRIWGNYCNPEGIGREEWVVTKVKEEMT